MLYKNTFLKIKKSFGRYISLLIIVMVGVGFYAGIQVTAPNITEVADNYFKDHKLMDFKIISSMGFTDDDADALEQINGVNDAVPSFSLDVQSRGDAIRIHAIEDSVNIVRLTAGQMPLSDTECVADSRNYDIGDIIEITDKVEDRIRNTEFAVVGLIESVLYLHDDYGSTTIGNGDLSSFAFISKDNFIMEAYTEIYVIADFDNIVSYSDKYKSLMESLNDKIVEIKSERENARFNEIYNKANIIIKEKEAELNREIEKAEKEFFDAKSELDDSLRELNEVKAAGIEKHGEENLFLDEIEANLKDGYAAYYINLEKYNAEIADAVNKLNDAKTELSNTERPVWYISDRNAAVGYDELDSSIQVVAIVAAVFPLFFISISMLMTSNSMARMITEERGELGTLTSLGYKDRDIVFTYLIYVLRASGLGAVIGYFAGCKVFPPLIYANFTFILPSLEITYDMATFGIILITTFALMISITIFSCSKELKQKPAYLMRPLPPKQGQQIALERIKPIWKHLSFTWKVTMRNMFRYKKRAFMTIVGVAGCASLLLVAFGLRDSMNSIAKKQYGDILRYDTMIILKDETHELSGELKELLDSQKFVDPLLIKQNAFKCDMNKKLLDVFLVTPQDDALFEQYFHLKSTVDKQDIVLNNGDVIITQRIATIYKLKKGDTVTIKDKDNNYYDLIISDVAENYASNYIYINAFTYGEIFNNPANFNAVVSNHYAEKTNMAEAFIDSGYAVSVVFTDNTIEKTLNNAKRLNGVIVLIVVVASILAAVVLYNLTAINISERTREIATLKVLGFRDSENNAYIYREAIILTLISIGIGLIFGIVLHRFVVNIIEMNALSLHKSIKWFSYVMACIITMIFSFLMQILTHFKLKKIDMIESL